MKDNAETTATLAPDQKPKGTLLLIGGKEEKRKISDRSTILNHLATLVKKAEGPLFIVTAATQVPEELAQEYTEVFTELGLSQVETLDIRQRSDAANPANVQRLQEAAAVFFTGGDQLRLTSQVADTDLFRCLQYLYYHEGLILAGTSAGAAAMSETMLTVGSGDQSPDPRKISLAAGLGFLPNTVIDSHFTQRGRIGRLLEAVVQNPKNVGIGIDEDTAIVVESNERMQVLGTGAVYIVDGGHITYSSLSEKDPDKIISMFDVRLHVIAEEHVYDLLNRRPIAGEITKEAESTKKHGTKGSS